MDSSIAALKDLEDAADDVCVEISEGVEHIAKRKVLAFVLAALRTQGWTGPAAKQLAGHVVDGYEAADLTAATRNASKIAEPWPQLKSWAEDPSVVDLFRTLLRQSASTTNAPGSSQFDLDSDNEGARWIVPDLLERGFIHAVSGDTGASKSIWRDAITAAGLRGEAFLGRTVDASRFMVIDGENPPPVVKARWKALGINNEHWPRLHFTDRKKGVLLGQPEWDEWLRHEVESFRPDVIFIDSVAKCCDVALLDNDSVIALYRDVLVPLVEQADCALVLTTHERKGRSGGSGDRSQEAMGARQWIDQADAHITLAPTGKFEQTPTGDEFLTRRPFAMRTPKHRWAGEDRAEHYVITGRMRSDRTPTEMVLEHPKAEPTNDEKLVAACGEDRLGRSELATRAGMNATGTAFRTALAKVIEDGRLVQGEDGLYEAGE